MRGALASRHGRAAVGWPAAGRCRRLPVIGPGADAPWPEQRAALENLDRYGLNGRVAVAANGQGFSASLRYQQQPRSFEPRARRPARHRRIARDSTARASRSPPAAARSSMDEAARDELERRLGFRLPLTELRWWLLGIPAPGEVEHQPGCGQRRDPRLHAERLARQHQLACSRPRVFAAAAADGRARRRAAEAAGRKLAAVSA